MSNSELLRQILSELRKIREELQSFKNIKSKRQSAVSRKNKFGTKDENIEIILTDYKGKK